MVRTKLIFHQKYQSFTSKVTDSNYDCNLFFSYVRVIQNHPPTPARISKYLAIPPTPLPLRIIKMAPNHLSVLS